jgi:hypothetical protein
LGVSFNEDLKEYREYLERISEDWDSGATQHDLALRGLAFIRKLDTWLTSTHHVSEIDKLKKLVEKGDVEVLWNDKDSYLTTKNTPKRNCCGRDPNCKKPD